MNIGQDIVRLAGKTTPSDQTAADAPTPPEPLTEKTETGQASEFEIDTYALGMDLIAESRSAGGNLPELVENGRLTPQKIGQVFAVKNPKHPRLSKFRKTVGSNRFDDAHLYDAQTTGYDAGRAVVGAAQALEPLGRGLTSGLTLGGSELAMKTVSDAATWTGEKVGLQIPEMYEPPDNMLYDLGEFIGSLAPYAKAFKLIRTPAEKSQYIRKIQKYLQDHPRMREYAEEALVGGSVEGIRGLLDPEGEAGWKALEGAGGGLAVRGATNVWRGARDMTKTMARPATGPGSVSARYPKLGPWAESVLEFFMNVKQGIDDEFVQILNKYGYPHLPSLSRPRDPWVTVAQKKVVRATAATPDLDRVARQMDAAHLRMSADMVAQLKPSRPVGVFNDDPVPVINKPRSGRGAPEVKVVPYEIRMKSNTDTGIAIREAYRKQVDGWHDKADALYEDVADKIGESPVDTNSLYTRLKNMLKAEGADPSGRSENTQINKVRNILSDLEKLSDAKDVPSTSDIEGTAFRSPDELLATVQQRIDADISVGDAPKLAEAKWKWLHQRYKALKKDVSGPPSQGDHIVFAARDILRDELATATAQLSDEAASLMFNANNAWATYKKMRWPGKNDENKLGKLIYETKGDDLVNKIFDSVSSIRDARSVLQGEAFELARQRWIKNILLESRPKSVMRDEVLKAKTHDIIVGVDVQHFNDFVSKKGGIDNEIFKEAFRGEPEKLDAWYTLHDVVNRVAPVRRQVAGIAEEAGGGEQGGFWQIVKNLFTQNSMALHFGGTKRLGQAFTAADENIFTGAPWQSTYRPAEGTLGRDVTRRAAPTQMTARMLGLVNPYKESE